jgi:type IV secretion system protein TrbG
MSGIFPGRGFNKTCEDFMRKKIFIMLLAGSMMIALSLAAAFGADLNSKVFSRNPRLSRMEKEALAVARRGESEFTVKPAIGPDGSVRYVFGAGIPSIVCAPLEITDVVLQPGEQVNSINIGDTVRWKVQPATSGPDDTLHLIIKPMDADLKTSMVVSTNWRSYHFHLVSHRTKYMPQVSFIYPEDALRRWKTIQTKAARERNANTLRNGEYLGNLDFAYNITGSAPWKPVRVYNDGRKTIIQMPKSMEQTEAPTLLVMRESNALFSGDQTVMVNYRIQHDRYIVDTVFKKAVLVAGVGESQARVTITRRK